MYKFIASITATAFIGLGATSLFINDVSAQQAPGGAASDDGEGKRKADPEVVIKPKIQIAILIDTSGSMDGLIDQARTQLWKIVNEFATVKQNGVTPDVEVALYEYG